MNDNKKKMKRKSKDGGGYGNSSNSTIPKKFKSGGGVVGKSSSSQHQQQYRQRRHADIVEQAKTVWNRLRLKTNTKEQVRKCMEELMPLLRGKCTQIALQHDASRVVQAAIQFGTPDERKQILKELCVQQSGDASNKKVDNSNNNNNLVELCKSQYAHFVVLKSLQYCADDEDCVDWIVKSLKGHVPKLCVHAVSSRVFEAVFTKLPPKKTAPLKQELYGPHLSLFFDDDSGVGEDRQNRGPAVPTLASNLRKPSVSDKTRSNAIEFVRNLVQKGMEKNLYGYAYFQELFSELLDFAGDDGREQRAMAGQVSDHALHLLSTKAGARVVAAASSYGTAKDRKRLLKSLKGYARSALLHRDAYLAILRLCQLTDDTVSIQKNVLNELLKPPEDSGDDLNPLKREEKMRKQQQKKEDSESAAEEDDNLSPRSPLLDLALSETASKLFLFLLPEDEEARRRYFDPYEHSVLSPAVPTVEEDGTPVPTSKKDPELRRKELLQHLREPLIEMCGNHAEDMLRSRPGALIFKEVYAAFDRPASMVDAAVDACLSSLQQKATSSNEKGDIAAETNGDDGDNGSEESELPLLEDRDGHLAVKHLVLVDASVTDTSDNEDEKVKSFSSEFYSRLTSEFGGDGKGLMKVASSSNRAAFVVAAMCKVPSMQQQLLSELKQNLRVLKKLAKGQGATAGYAALVKEVSSA